MGETRMNQIIIDVTSLFRRQEAQKDPPGHVAVVRYAFA